MLIDTHSHIYSDEFNGELNKIIARSVENNVRKIILPNIDSSTIKQMLDLHNRFPEVCYPLIGLHPTSVKEDFLEELELVEYWLNKRKFWGVGEIGIDLYWDQSFLEEQRFAFRHQLKIAKKHNLPVSIHVRDSFDEVYNIVKEENTDSLLGVFHSFTGTLNQARQVLDMGFKIGVNGIVTFKNSGLDRLIAQLSINDLVLETDSPYLAPSPLRGQRNESSNTVLIQNKIAEILAISTTEVEEVTSNNAITIFKLQNEVNNYKNFISSTPTYLPLIS